MGLSSLSQRSCIRTNLAEFDRAESGSRWSLHTTKDRKASRAREDSAFDCNIFPDVKQLVNRIGNIGGVDRIELTQLGGAQGERVTIDASAQEFVREIEYRPVPGSRTEISGVITRLFPQSFRLEIQVEDGSLVRISMSEKQFERIRRLPVLWSQDIRFEGVPIYRFDSSGGAIHEFRAEPVIVPRNRRKRL